MTEIMNVFKHNFVSKNMADYPCCGPHNNYERVHIMTEMKPRWDVFREKLDDKVGNVMRYIVKQ